MATAQVRLGARGEISSYKFDGVRTIRSAFVLPHLFDYLIDCVVIDTNGSEVREALLDNRGNVSDGIYPFLPGPFHGSPHQRIHAGWGNIFGSDVRFIDMNEPPKKREQISTIGNFCVFEDGSLLDTDQGFDIGDSCVIGGSARVLGHLEMGNHSTIGYGVVVGKRGIVTLGRGAEVGDRARINGTAVLEQRAHLGEGFQVRRKLTVNLPAGAEAPMGSRRTIESV